MDGYKKIIRSKKLRQSILSMMSILPDNLMLKMQYYIKLHRTLDLNNPTRFTEKIQWYKINYRDSIIHQCVDKYQVRDFIREKGLENILIKMYGHYDSVENIEWEKLPESFVVKTTNGGGGLNVVICTNKDEFIKNDLNKKLEIKGKSIHPNTGGREWAYYGLETKIIIEELLVNPDNPKAGVSDYKIFCYYGKARYIVVDVDRYIAHKRNFYNLKWENLNIISDCPAADIEIPKPMNFEKMLSIAEKISEGFPFVRVDLYNIKGKIYFGEMTFYPWSGYVQFIPDKFDYALGEYFELPLDKSHK